MGKSQMDWNEIWKDKYDRVLNQIPSEKPSEKKNFWSSKENALEYLKKSKEHPEQMDRILQVLPLSNELKVLEIGAGPGNVAIPISDRVAHVTALEPADGMMAVLQEQIAENSITNMIAVQKRWEDVDFARDLNGPYDLIIVSHGVVITDMQAAVRKVCAASRRWVYIFWGAGKSTWEQRMIDLWPVLHERNYQSGPRADVLYHLLYDMGIYPNVISEQHTVIRKYPDLDTVVQKFGRFFNISTPEQEGIFRDYMKTTLETAENGFLDRERSCSATFWWDVSWIGQDRNRK